MTASPRALFFDIDGTLITKTGGPFQEDLAAMEAAAAAGHRLFINTGRSFANIPPALLDIPFWSGAAAGGGAHILMTGPGGTGRSRYRTVYHKWVSGELLAALSAWYLHNSGDIVFEGEDDCFFISRAGTFSRKNVKIIKKENDFLTRYSGALISKLTIEGMLSPPERRLLEDHFQLNVFPGYTEAIIKGESKAGAMGFILDRTGIRRENSIALGDGVNDIDMIRFAGLGIAMGNACAELKAAARALTGCCGEGGVAEALGRYVN